MHGQSKYDLSVVVAAYNEEPIIIDSLRSIVEELDKRPQVKWELILINDGSSDRTKERMEEFARQENRANVLNHKRNFGQGRALRNGFQAAQGNIIVTLDADLSYKPNIIYAMTDALVANQVEIVLASAYNKDGQSINVPFFRNILSRVANFYLSHMFPNNIGTSTCVVRAYTREAIDSLLLTSDGMELQIEILMKALLLNYRIIEIPATLQWSDQKAEDSHRKRKSKMAVWRSIKMYLFLGWLSRPATLFILLSLLLIIPGIYMGIMLMINIFLATWHHLPDGFYAISYALNEVFHQRTYAVVFTAAFLLIGLQVLAVALNIKQSKFYFEEQFLMRTVALMRTKRPNHRGFGLTDNVSDKNDTPEEGGALPNS